MKRAAAFVCVLLIAVISGCGEDRDDAGGSGTPHGVPPPGGAAVNATVREWRLTIDTHKVDAGPVRFTTANLGTITHEFVVVRTDIPEGQIPIDGDRFSEEAPGVSSPGEIPEFEPSTVGETVIDLEPGLYQIVCNIEKHYGRGMHASLEVV